MSETIETFNPAHLNRSDTLSSVVTVGRSVPASTKAAKNASSSHRLDFEPLYTDLKHLIGHNWGIYHDALTRFMRGELSSLEFGDLTDIFLRASPAVEHAHNSLTCAILFNTTRDVPEPGPAAWVSAASDKAPATATSKPSVASDAVEQRLKVEVMSLPPRDRRRIKAMNNEKGDEDILASRRNGYEEYYQAGRIKVLESVPASAGGLNKTNWDLEIKKRYMQPLFSETLEFPDAASIFARMVPICYEESIASGSTVPCAELVSIAAESFVKDFLGHIFNRTRINGPRYENGAGNGVFTSGYKLQLEKEEDGFKRGNIQRGRDNGLLPIESRESSSRRPICVSDMKIASSVGMNLWNGMPLIGSRVMESTVDDETEDWGPEEATESNSHATASGAVLENGDDAMEVDEDNYGWDGVGAADREALGSILEDCLAIRA